MGFDTGCILNNQSLPVDYFCPVCHLLVDPRKSLQAKCTHLYCKACLTYIVRTTHTCPCDGCQVSEADSKSLLESNPSLADAIGKIRIRCIYYVTGCKWEGLLSDCASHSSTCAYGEAGVVCNRCSMEMPHWLVYEHAENCPGKPPQAPQGPRPSVLQGQMQTVPSAAPGPQAQSSVPPVSGVGNLYVNTSAQQQAAQATMPAPQDWYDQWQQYHYPHAPALPYPQQHYQGLPPQVYGQAWPQVYPHGQPQPQQQAVQPQVQQGVNMQPHALVRGQAPPSQAVPYTQSQSFPQAQPYAQPQPVPQPQMPFHNMPPLPPPYPPPQIQQQSQAQVQSQPYPQPTAQDPCIRPQQSYNALGGHQSHPQPPPPPPPPPYPQPTAQDPRIRPQQSYNVSSWHQSHPQPLPQAHPQPPPQVAQQHAQYTGGFGWKQGLIPLQPPQKLPTQPCPPVPNLQQPAQAQAPTEKPMLQPGYPSQECPDMLAGQQALPQQSLSGEGPAQQPQLQCGPQPNVAQHYPGQQMGPHGGGSQPHVPTAGLSGDSQVSSIQMNQTYPRGANSSGQQDTTAIEKFPDRDNGVKYQNEMNHAGIELKLIEHGVQQGTMMKGSTPEGISSSGVKTANQHHRATDLEHVGKGAHGSSSSPSVYQGGNQPQSMLSRPSASQRPGSSVPDSMPHPSTPLQPASPGHCRYHLRPQGPGQLPPGPPFNGVNNTQPSTDRHPYVSTPRENPSGAAVVPGSSDGQHSNVGQGQGQGQGQGLGSTFHAVQSKNPRGEPFVRPSFTETTERGPFVPPGSLTGIPGAADFGSHSVHGSQSAPDARDDRFKPIAQEHSKPLTGLNDNKHPYGDGRSSGLRTKPGDHSATSRVLPSSHQAADFHDDKSRKDNSGHADFGDPVHGRRFSGSQRARLPPRSPAQFGGSNRDRRFPAPSGGLARTQLPRPEHQPCGESVRVERSGDSPTRKAGSRSSYGTQICARDGGFGSEDYVDPAKRKCGSIDLDSPSRERQTKKKHFDPTPGLEGTDEDTPKTSKFKGCGNNN